jgi:hypothetical protein
MDDLPSSSSGLDELPSSESHDSGLEELPSSSSPEPAAAAVERAPGRGAHLRRPLSADAVADAATRRRVQRRLQQDAAELGATGAAYAALAAAWDTTRLRMGDRCSAEAHPPAPRPLFGPCL